MNISEGNVLVFGICEALEIIRESTSAAISSTNDLRILVRVLI